MDIEKIVAQVKAKYPGKKIIVENDSVSAEIIGETAKSSMQGELVITIDGAKHVLKQGEKITIHPAEIHSAEGAGAWFLTHSEPAWTPEDHILAG